MDITLLPPTSILSHHSHQLYTQQSSSLPSTMSTLLPSALPRAARRYSSFAPAAYPRGYAYRPKRRSHEPPPPLSGASPFSDLPDELMLDILSFLDWEDLLALRPTNRRLATLALSPCLHSSITLLSLPPDPVPPILQNGILPHVKHLHLHLFPYPSPLNSSHPSSVLLSVLQALPPNQLRSLSLPFSAPYLPATDLGVILKRIGGRLEKLDLRGSGVTGTRWLEWMEEVGSTSGLSGGLKELDLGFTAISLLPSSSSMVNDSPRIGQEPRLDAFRSLTRLSLASCAGLSSATLASFLADLPPSIQYLDLSRLEQVSFPALWGMRVVHPSHADTALLVDTEPEPTALRELKLVGIDHLTRQNIRRLKAHWEEQRRSCFPETLSLSPLQPPKMRVWGEPHTPENQTVGLPEGGVGMGGTDMSPVNSFGSSGSSGSSGSGISSGTASTTTSIRTPISTNVSRLMPWMSPPDALALAAAGKLPNHPYLPSPSHPKAKPAASAYGRSPRTPPSLNTIHCGQGRLSPPEAQRVAINIVHSAILESEDEAGYRQFIGEVTGGVVALGAMGGMGGAAVAATASTIVGDQGGLGLGLGLGGWHGGLGFDVEEQGGQMPEEVDGGGWM